jgi:Spy/CpxP family protein refolding chaperone
MLEHRKEMEANMKAYDAELKKILTDDQYKSYQADQKKKREKRRGPRNIE